MPRERVTHPTFSRAPSSLMETHRSFLASFLMKPPQGLAFRIELTIPTTTRVLSTLHRAAWQRPKFMEISSRNLQYVQNGQTAEIVRFLLRFTCDEMQECARIFVPAIGYMVVALSASSIDNVVCSKKEGITVILSELIYFSVFSIYETTFPISNTLRNSHLVGVYPSGSGMSSVSDQGKGHSLPSSSPASSARGKTGCARRQSDMVGRLFGIILLTSFIR